jgi:site-specific DNA-cytosine methylase
MRTVDLFAGCGGFSLGFQQAGFDIVAAFDHWQPAIDIYRDNFTHPIFDRDLGDPAGYVSIVNFAPELKHSGDACDLNDQLRPLTTIERSYLQTFPKTFKFKGSKSDLEQAIGNAVPVNLSKYVANCIKKSIDCDALQERLQQATNKQLQLF